MLTEMRTQVSSSQSTCGRLEVLSGKKRCRSSLRALEEQMDLLKKHRLEGACTIAGIFLGYLVIHPFSGIVYMLVHLHQSKDFHLHWQNLIGTGALEAFKPVMLPMAVAFATLGGVIGLLAGIIAARRKKLGEAELAREKKKIALATMKKLVVTLSHYLLNANMIIGGKVRHCRKGTSSKDILAALEVIEDQGRKIDAVIKSLREVSEI
jgi:hypothetical protein